MQFSILPFLFLFFHTSWSAENSFIIKSTPVYPKLGEDVLLACKLTAPDGHKFHGKVPDLNTSNIDHHFNFDDIHSKFGDRYHGWTSRDSSSTYLQGFIFISSLQESDLSVIFNCFQRVQVTDEEKLFSLILGELVQTTDSTPAMVANSIDPSNPSSLPTNLITSTDDITSSKTPDLLPTPSNSINMKTQISRNIPLVPSSTPIFSGTNGQKWDDVSLAWYQVPLNWLISINLVISILILILIVIIFIIYLKKRREKQE